MVTWHCHSLLTLLISGCSAKKGFRGSSTSTHSSSDGKQLEFFKPFPRFVGMYSKMSVFAKSKLGLLVDFQMRLILRVFFSCGCFSISLCTSRVCWVYMIIQVTNSLHVKATSVSYSNSSFVPIISIQAILLFVSL